MIESIYSDVIQLKLHTAMRKKIIPDWNDRRYCNILKFEES